MNSSAQSSPALQQHADLAPDAANLLSCICAIIHQHHRVCNIKRKPIISYEQALYKTFDISQL